MVDRRASRTALPAHDKGGRAGEVGRSNVGRLRATARMGHTSRNVGQATRGRAAAPGNPMWVWPGDISAIGAPWPDRGVMDIALIAGWCTTSRTNTASRAMPPRRPLHHRDVIPRPPKPRPRFSAGAASYPPAPPSLRSPRRVRSPTATPRVVVRHINVASRARMETHHLSLDARHDSVHVPLSIYPLGAPGTANEAAHGLSHRVTVVSPLHQEIAVVDRDDAPYASA